MEQLVGHAPHGLQHLGAGGLVEAGQPGGEPLHLRVDHRGGHRAQRDDGGRHARLAAYGEEGGDLLPDDGADVLYTGGGLEAAQLVGEAREADQLDARQVGDRRVDVVRQGEVDDGERAGAAAARGHHVGEADQRLGRAGAGDDDVGGGELVAQRGQRHRRGGVLRGEPLGVGGGAVEHRDAAGSTAGEVRHGERRHRTGAEHDGTCTGDRHRAALERGGDEGGSGAVDVGLGVRALADAQGLLEEGVEGRADGAVLLAHAQRLAGLAEDLALADDHRVEAGRDLEEVGDRALVVVDVEVRQQGLGRLRSALHQEAGEVLDTAVEAVDLGVDLEAVARDDGRGLGDVLAGDDVGDQLDGAVGVEREALEQLDRRGLVGDPHDQDAHDTAPAPGAIDLRCSW